MLRITTLLLLTFPFLASAQNISGIINTYYPVTGINTTTFTLTAGSVTGISAGDTLLLIQMQGAVINTNNNSNYGDVNNYNGAGSFEFVRVCSVVGNDITLAHDFVNTYDPAGGVQLISIPRYTNATVTDTLTCQPWDGSTGGVVVLDASNTLTLNADVDVTGKGFRAGQHFESTYNCFFTDDYSDFEYSVSGGLGAQKGEGIANYGTNDGGRGALANGGGGGNDHNSGGGGGSNISFAGQGGDNDEPGAFNCHGYYPGAGGKALDHTANRLFMGGGGGAGHSNSVWNSSGGNGGGVIIIRAGTIDGNGFTLRSDGVDGLSGFGDGAGGGGAGGTIALDVNSFTSTLSIDANAGNGADSDGFTSNRCFGPGGGGSGGLIWFNSGSTPGGVTVSYLPGINGVVGNSTNPCQGLAQNATGGNLGLSDFLFSIPSNIMGGPGDPLQPIFSLGNDTTICAGESLVLDPNFPNASSYTWSTSETTETISVAAAGNYSVEVALGGCIGRDTIDVTLGSSPTLLSYTDTVLCSYLGLDLSAENDGADYLWSTSEISQLINITEAGTYSVTITEPPIGCSLAQTVEVIACDNNLDIPNVITPNGDGFNDTWIIADIFAYPNNTVKIYNRNGALVHEATNYNNDWDGSDLPATTYYYVLDPANGGNTLNGTITIVREQ